MNYSVSWCTKVVVALVDTTTVILKIQMDNGTEWMTA